MQQDSTTSRKLHSVTIRRSVGKGKARPAPVPTAIDAFMETLLFLRGRQRNGQFSSQQQERKRLRQVQLNASLRRTQIADGNILNDVQVKISTARGENERAVNGRSPYDLIVDRPFDVLTH